MLNATQKSMLHLSRLSSTALQLDLTLFPTGNPKQSRMLQAIAAETENTRAALRKSDTWGTSLPLPARGMMPLIGRQQTKTLADMLPWPALLTLKECADNAARAAGCGNREEILEFAISICPYEHLVTLLNFTAHASGIADTAKILSPLIRGLKAKQDRIKQGAKIGGIKSARERRKKSKVPEHPKLLQEHQRLLDAGKDAKDIAGILAQRYGVAPNTIRRNFRAANAAKAI